MLTRTSCEARYTGDGNSTIFTFTFPFVVNTDIVVTTVNPITEAETVLVEDAGYTLTGAGSPSGGTVTTTAPVTSDHILLIQRIKPITQTWDVRNQGAYNAQQAEASADKLTMICQQLAAGINKTVQINPTLDPDTYRVVLPVPQPSTVLVWNDEGDALENVPVADVTLVGGTTDQVEVDDGVISIAEPQRHMPGDIKMSASLTATAGWLWCNGAAVNRVTYAALFAAIGTSYGVGNGSTTFNLPDLRGRFPLGFNPTVGGGGDPSLDTYLMGAEGGQEEVLLIEENLPSHHHEVSAPLEYAGYGSYELKGVSHGPGEVDTSSVGGNVAHNNMPPYGVIKFYIHI